MKLWPGRAGFAAVCLLACAVMAAPRAAAVDFTMTVNPNLSPPGVAPGGVSSESITIVTGSGFVGPITFGCTVTPSVSSAVEIPTCVVSPATMSASGGASATISTQAPTSTQPGTTTISYGITITATDASGTITSPTLSLTVLAVTPQFTITIQNSVAPTSVPAGAGAEANISVNPVNGYQTPTGTGKGITLYCASITPLVTLPPYCSFSYPGGDTTLHITSDASVTSTLTINTLGATTLNCANPLSRRFYAIWVGLPMLGLVGLGGAAGGRRSRKAWLLVATFVVGAGFLLTPSCSNTTKVCTPNGITPANTYQMTIVGVDSNGVASSNTTSTSSGPTVSLTVTAPIT